MNSIAHSGVSVLNVDDNDGHRYAISQLLSQRGFRVTEAKSGEEALAEVAKRRPDAILLDIGLPGINGFEVCRLLKLGEQTRNIAVVQLTATYLDDFSRDESLQAGADDYAVHPVEPDELISRLRRAIGYTRGEFASPGNGPFVINVSTNESLLETRTNLLRQAGYTVADAANYSQLTRACAGRRPDLVILGHSLPAPERARVVEVLDRDCAGVPVLALFRYASYTGDRRFHMLSSHDGPAALIAKVRSILAPTPV